MRLIPLFALSSFLVAGPGLAQQTAGPTATVPSVAAGGTGIGAGPVDRPGGISYVTRPRPTAGAVMAASGFFAAGGVRVTAPVARDPSAVGIATTGGSFAGAARTPRTPAGTAVAVAASGSSETQVLTTLQRLAAAGNRDAQRALSALSRGGR